MAVGQAILTTAGFAALADAAAHGTTIQPLYFKFASVYAPYVDEFGNLDPAVTEMVTGVWKTQNINYYRIVNATRNQVEFTCDVTQAESNQETWVCGLFLNKAPDPDVLFMLALAPEAFPAQLRQVFRVQLAFTDAGDLIDFVVQPLTTFLELTDTPDSYAGQSGKVPVVNSLESALEFVPLVAEHLYDIGDVEGSDYTNKKGYVLEVNPLETGVRFSAANQQLVERAYEDLGFLATLLTSEREIVIEYFDSGFSGTYSVDGEGAVALITLPLTYGSKIIEMTYDTLNENRLSTVTFTIGTEVVAYTLSYSSVTGSISGVTVNTPS